MISLSQSTTKLVSNGSMGTNHFYASLGKHMRWRYGMLEEAIERYKA
jgi:hypothetical protein